MATLPGRCQGPAGQFRTPWAVGNHAQDVVHDVVCWWVGWGVRGSVVWPGF